MKPSAIKCLTCERHPAVQHYDGVRPIAVLCMRCGHQYKLTPVLDASPEQIQVTTARA